MVRRARATGVVTLGFLTASVLLGILTSFRWSSPTWPRFVVEFVHRNVSLLVLVFLAIHVVTVVADSFAPIRWIDVVIPFVSAYRPFWLGLGAVAVDLLIALVVTSLLRHRIGFTHLAIRALACVRVLAGRGVARPRYRLRYAGRGWCWRSPPRASSRCWLPPDCASVPAWRRGRADARSVSLR